MIETARLRLVPATRGMLEAELANDHATLGALLGARVETWPPELYDAGAIQWTLHQYDSDPMFRDWGLVYFVRAGETPTLIGVGGYKGAPRDGFVEIGYSVIPAYKRQGFATEATLAMTRRAFDDPRVVRVIAHTLAELTPSIGVLEKSGFTQQPDALEEGVIMFALDRADWRG